MGQAGREAGGVLELGFIFLYVFKDLTFCLTGGRSPFFSSSLLPDPPPPGPGSSSLYNFSWEEDENLFSSKACRRFGTIDALGESGGGRGMKAVAF